MDTWSTRRGPDGGYGGYGSLCCTAAQQLALTPTCPCRGAAAQLAALCLQRSPNSRPTSCFPQVTAGPSPLTLDVVQQHVLEEDDGVVAAGGRKNGCPECTSQQQKHGGWGRATRKKIPQCASRQDIPSSRIGRPAQRCRACLPADGRLEQRLGVGHGGAGHQLHACSRAARRQAGREGG